MNHFSDQGAYAIRCEWGLQGVAAVGTDADLVIVVDILSFSTVIDVAVSRGAVVYPHRWKDDTGETRARELGAVLARSRTAGGLSLSPASMLVLSPGQRVVLSSPSGATISLAAATVAPHVVCASLRNASAVARYAAQFTTIAVIPAGERWPDASLRPAVEDLAGAGAVISLLRGSRSPEAQAAAAVWQNLQPVLREALSTCASGRQLIDAGYQRDVEMATEVDVSQAVPLLQEGAYAAR